MNSNSFAHFQAVHDAQMPPDAPRYREPSEAEIVEHTGKVLTAWRSDEARFAETVADVLCLAPPSVQEELATLAHQDDAAAFGKAVLAMFKAQWNAAARQRAEDELAGLV